jgi:hypothetical protein
MMDMSLRKKKWFPGVRLLGFRMVVGREVRTSFLRDEVRNWYGIRLIYPFFCIYVLRHGRLCAL